jgi:hypothetical protein
MSFNDLRKVDAPYVFLDQLAKFDSFSRSPSPQESETALQYFREIAKGNREFDCFAESSCLHPFSPSRVKIGHVCTYNANESRSSAGAYQAVFSHDDSTHAFFRYDLKKRDFTRVDLCIGSRSTDEEGASFGKLVFVTNSIWRKHSNELFVSENGRIKVHVSPVTTDDLIDLLSSIMKKDLTVGETFSKKFFEDFVRDSFPDVYQTIFKINQICYRSYLE